MNGNVFIGWCSSNELAIKVSNALTEHSYRCIVGGKYDDVSNLYVGGTILKQLNSCNQALFIVQKNSVGAISNNVIFEIGYSLSKFNTSANRLHLFYLDIDSKDKSIPSDLLGAWAHHIETAGKSQEEIVKIITDSFLSNQKMQVIRNKMSLVNDWYSLNDTILSHFDSPSCSDFEMAQYLIFYAVSSGFINIFPQMKECLSVIRKNIDENSEEFYNAFRLANVIYSVGCSVKRADNKPYLDDSTYIEASETLVDLIDWIESYSKTEQKRDETDFNIWFEMVAKQRHGYISMMYVNNPELSEEEVTQGYKEAIDYCNQTIELCDKLRDLDSKSNRELSSLYKSFAERNLSIAYAYLGNHDEERNHKYRAFEEKKYLREYSKDLNLDTRIADSFEREYYLSMAEIIKYEQDARKKRMYIKEIDAYANYMLTVRDSSNQYVNRIKLMIESKETMGV